MCSVQGTCDDGLDCNGTKCVAAGGSESTSSGTSGTTAATTTNMSTTTQGATTELDTSSESGPVVPCGMADFRVVTFNVLGVDAQGSDAWNALGAILGRISPDVACIEEIDDGETASLRALTEALGWAEPIQADTSPAIGGELRNGCLGSRPMKRIDSYTASDLQPGANDLSRDVIAVRVDLDDGCHVNVLDLHAKSGQEDLDRFRRQVEFVRVAQAIADVRARYPGEPLIVMGDFNSRLDDPMIGQSFDALPTGLPESYALGDDITFPVVYDPFDVLTGAGMTRIDPTAEDSPRDSTWGVSGGFDGVRLDYIWLDGIDLGGAVIYDACLDDGMDAPPAGAWLPLTGDPLPCGTSTTASDHQPIAADLHVP